MSKNKYQGIDPYVVNQVSYHARSLMRHSAIHGVEVEDLEQERFRVFFGEREIPIVTFEELRFEESRPERRRQA